jgi:hypothetical protein
MKLSGIFHAAGLADAGGEVARLRQVQTLVREIGRLPVGRCAGAMDESARISAAYSGALPIVQWRFDEEAAIMARWASAGLEALLTLDEAGRPIEAASRRLAAELETGLGRLAKIVGA